MSTVSRRVTIILAALAVISVIIRAARFITVGMWPVLAHFSNAGIVLGIPALVVWLVWCRIKHHIYQAAVHAQQQATKAQTLDEK